MKTSKPKEIIIKNQNLRKIRKNLRDLLVLAYKREFSRLLSIESLYQEKK
jgi:hypothetical protein